MEKCCTDPLRSCSPGTKSRNCSTWSSTNMDTLREILSPDFLLRNSIYISLLVGLVCPLVGVYLTLRRLIFMGVALPQISSFGIAFAFSLQAWGVIPHMHAHEHSLAFIGYT